MLGEGDLENAMRDQIGVPANRTGEMTVRTSAEGVVTLVMRFVHGSSLGAQEQRIDLRGKRRARRILDRRVNSARVAEHDARSEPALHGPELRERFGR